MSIRIVCHDFAHTNKHTSQEPFFGMLPTLPELTHHKIVRLQITHSCRKSPIIEISVFGKTPPHPQVSLERTSLFAFEPLAVALALSTNTIPLESPLVRGPTALGHGVRATRRRRMQAERAIARTLDDAREHNCAGINVHTDFERALHTGRVMFGAGALVELHMHAHTHIHIRTQTLRTNVCTPS
jgi:hypothetical protein